MWKRHRAENSIRSELADDESFVPKEENVFLEMMPL